MKKLLCHWPKVIGLLCGIMVTQMTIQSYEYHATRFKQMVGHKAVLKTTGETVTIVDRLHCWPFCVDRNIWVVAYQNPEDRKPYLFQEQVLDVQY